jgi:hypothetical protein
MSTEVNPESLRTHAEWMDDHHGEVEAAALRREADRLEREQRPLPTVPGWYPGIVVERGGESCIGVILTDDESWVTALRVDYSNYHDPDDWDVTIRWVEQDGKTPGQTLWEETCRRKVPWRDTPASTRDRYGYLAAHGTPTLTPVGESPEPGTRGLLPVVQDPAGWYCHATAVPFRVGDMGSVVSHTVLADPRPDGAT